jgi:hypothetical protein
MDEAAKGIRRDEFQQQQNEADNREGHHKSDSLLGSDGQLLTDYSLHHAPGFERRVLIDLIDQGITPVMRVSPEIFTPFRSLDIPQQDEKRGTRRA